MFDRLACTVVNCWSKPSFMRSFIRKRICFGKLASPPRPKVGDRVPRGFWNGITAPNLKTSHTFSSLKPKWPIDRVRQAD